MNVIEKALLIIVFLVMAIFMLPTILGIVFGSLSGDVLFIIIAAFIIGIIAIPFLVIKHKEE